MRQKLIILASLIGICGFFIYLSCCDDCPTCPGDIEPPPLGNYRIFAHSMETQTIAVIDTPGDTLIDVIQLDFAAYGVFGLPSSSRLLITNIDKLKMQVMDANSLELREELDQYGDYYFDETDNYGILSSFVNDMVYLIDPLTLATIDSISGNILYGYLDTVTNTFWGANTLTDSSGSIKFHNMIFKINCDDFTQVDTILLDTEDIATVNVAYSWRTNDLYFQAKDMNCSFILVYDLDSKSSEIILYMTENLGGLTISPDGKYIYITDSGNGFFSIFPRGDIYIIDVETEQVCDLIPPYAFPGGSFSYPLWGQMIITPDTRRMYVASNRNAAGTEPVIVVDLLENKIIDYVLPFDGFFAESIAFLKKSQIE